MTFWHDQVWPVGIPFHFPRLDLQILEWPLCPSSIYSRKTIIINSKLGLKTSWQIIAFAQHHFSLLGHNVWVEWNVVTSQVFSTLLCQVGTIIVLLLNLHLIASHLTMGNFQTSDTSTDTSDTICAYPLAINRIRFGPQLTLQEGSYHYSLMEEQHMPEGHPSRY